LKRVEGHTKNTDCAILCYQRRKDYKYRLCNFHIMLTNLMKY
jgi:hypothetical protein